MRRLLCLEDQTVSRSIEPRVEVLQVTNPELLDFLGDELALTCISAAELPGAFKLFDAALQTRRAAKGPHENAFETHGYTLHI